ncbi:MAG: TonB-dependent receptor, partial [Prevotella sp.]|nr:TonB-dependent receptor [Prevotella sp.]
YYRYRSLDDFLTGAAPETVGLAYGYNGATSPTSEVKFNQYGIYLQDEWNVNDRLKLTGGIRFDNIAFDDDDIMTNNAIKALDFGGKHIDTGMWPKSNIQISPRVGFVWDVLGNKSLKVRGGTGLFAGRLPLVFFTNMPSNSGMIQQNPFNAVTKYNSDGTVKSSDPLLNNFKGGLVTDRDKIRELLGAPANITPDDGTLARTIGGVDRNFKMPQVWKSSLAVDYQVPVSFPMTLTAEFIYTKKITDVMLKNYNIKDDTSEWEHLNGADNRLVYPKNFTYYSNINDACVLTNTHKGYGYTFNITATAEPLKNLNVMAAYTHTVMKEVSGMPGSNASSAWSGLYTINGPNFSKVQNSQYVIPDRIIANVSYKYAKDHFSLFYTGYSPSGYSFLYNGDINGDGIKNDLMYIPRNDSEISFVSDADRQAFWKFVEQDKYLKNHKGEYAEAYSARAPFIHRFDFRWAHDFDVKIGNTRNRLQLSLNIMNVGNLFNSKWGVAKNMGSCNNGQVLKVNKVENNTPVFSMMKVNGEYATKTWNFNHNYDQCWKMQIGIKYTFN